MRTDVSALELLLGLLRRLLARFAGKRWGTNGTGRGRDIASGQREQVEAAEACQKISLMSVQGLRTHFRSASMAHCTTSDSWSNSN